MTSKPFGKYTMFEKFVLSKSIISESNEEINKSTERIHVLHLFTSIE